MFITNQIIICTKDGISKHAADGGYDWENQEIQTLNPAQAQSSLANFVQSKTTDIKQYALEYLLKQGVKDLESYIISPTPQGAGELARAAIISATEAIASNMGGAFL